MPRARTWNRDSVLQLASTQEGLITAAQLATLGVPRSTVSRSHSLGGMFTWVLPGIHRVDGRGRLSPEQRETAALLYAGPAASLTGASVLRRIGLKAAGDSRLLPPDCVHVSIPHATKRASHSFVQVERTLAPPRTRVVQGLPCAFTARAVLDAVRRCTEQDVVRAVIFEAVQRGFVVPEQLEDERRLGQIRGTRFARLALEEVFAGVRSMPEAEIWAAFERRGVGGLLYNPRLYREDGTFVASPDVYDPSTGVCLEVDSREHHFQVQTWEATMQRHSTMTAAGLAVLHAPPSRIRSAPDSVVDDFLAAVAARRGVTPQGVVVLEARGQAS